jgi:hypothetical protein
MHADYPHTTAPSSLKSAHEVVYDLAWVENLDILCTEEKKCSRDRVVVLVVVVVVVVVVEFVLHLIAVGKPFQVIIMWVLVVVQCSLRI